MTNTPSASTGIGQPGAPAQHKWQQLVSVASMNHKGGVAKTNVTANHSALFAQQFGPALVIDSDQQGTLTKNLGCNKFHPGLNQVLLGQASLVDCLQKANDQPNLYVLGPGTGLEFLGRPEKLDESLSRPEISAVEYAQRLNAEIETANQFLPEPFQAVFFDMPPGYSTVTDVVLLVAKRVVVPVCPAEEVVDGVASLLAQLELKREYNPELAILGVLITRFKKNEDQLQYIKLFHKGFPENTPFFDAIIPENQGTSSAATFSKPAVLYDKEGSGARAYRKYFKQFVVGIKKEFGYGA